MMKKIILICLLMIAVLPANATVVFMDKKENPKNELFIDESGLYRYIRAEDVYRRECQDAYPETSKKKCMESARASWEMGKTPDEIKKEGKLFTGKIRMPSANGKEDYFYANEGIKGAKIQIFSKKYYFEKAPDGRDLLCDLTTEAPYTGAVPVGGVETLSSQKGKGRRFVAFQEYERGLPIGNPYLQLVD